MKKLILSLSLVFSIFLLAGCNQNQATISNEPMKTGLENESEQQTQPTPDGNKQLTTLPPGQPKSAAPQPNQTEPLEPASHQPDSTKAAPTTTELSDKYEAAIIHTNMGDIKVKFFSQDSPQTVNNFMKLALEKFYDGTKFHRVIKDFMIQGGDPNSKDENFADDGKGGPGYKFKDEFNSHKLVKGSLAMANSGPNTNGSQFFIVTKSATPWLDGKHTNFGEVTAGLDIVDKIENVKTGANDHPTENVTIQSIELLEKK